MSLRSTGSSLHRVQESAGVSAIEYVVLFLVIVAIVLTVTH
jgi:hypothetical protein